MARTKAGAVPQLQHHKGTGQGKVHLGGRDFYCGKWGTPECKAAYDRLIAEWLHNGRRPPARPVRTPTPPDALSHPQREPRSEPVVEVRLDPTGSRGGDNYRGVAAGLLICEIADRYMGFCEIYYRDAEGKPTSTFGNAKQALAALEPFEDLPSTSFGPKKLQEMRELLVQQGRPRKGVRPVSLGHAMASFLYCWHDPTAAACVFAGRSLGHVRFSPRPTANP